MASGKHRPQRYSPGTRVWVERTPGQVVDVDEYGRLWVRAGGAVDGSARAGGEGEMKILDHLHHQSRTGHPRAQAHALALLWELPREVFEPEPEPAPVALDVLTWEDAETVGHALRSSWRWETVGE